MTNNKGDLVSHVARATGLRVDIAETAVDAVLGGIDHLTKDGDKLILRKFGTFARHYRRASVTRNPRTGAPIQVLASTRLKFKQAKKGDGR